MLLLIIAIIPTKYLGAKVNSARVSSALTQGMTLANSLYVYPRFNQCSRIETNQELPD